MRHLAASSNKRQETAATYREIGDLDLGGAVLKFEPPYEILPDWPERYLAALMDLKIADKVAKFQ
jgi:hypothetical protein